MTRISPTEKENVVAATTFSANLVQEAVICNMCEYFFFRWLWLIFVFLKHWVPLANLSFYFSRNVFKSVPVDPAKLTKKLRRTWKWKNTAMQTFVPADVGIGRRVGHLESKAVCSLERVTVSNEESSWLLVFQHRYSYGGEDSLKSRHIGKDSGLHKLIKDPLWSSLDLL